MYDLEYTPGFERSEQYCEAKRRLLRETVETSTARLCDCCSDAVEFEERVTQLDVDDTEFDLDVYTLDTLAKDGLAHMRFMLSCTDERRFRQADMRQPSYVVRRPELTEQFHRSLEPDDKRVIANIVFGRAMYEAQASNSTLIQINMLPVLRRRYNNLMDELSAIAPIRVNFSVI